jgi:hypothetical protein
MIIVRFEKGRAKNVLTKMTRKTDGVYINKKKEFSLTDYFDKDTLKKTLDFAYDMSFGNTGAHRTHRSGGTHQRLNGEIFADTFQGKLSEFAVYRKLVNHFKIEEPDLSTYGLGLWDDSDIVVAGKKIAIKSTKSIGNLILLETKDWNQDGDYIPNLEKKEGSYDYFILVRVDPFCETILKLNRMHKTSILRKEELQNVLMSEKWGYDIPGYITKKELIYAIKGNHIINQGELLNGRVRMDASNYYVQSGDLSPISSLVESLSGI